MGLFREYDLRGIVGKELTEEIAEKIGRGYCTYVKDRGVKTISVGRDGRLSSPGLHKALMRGLLEGGLNVIDIGICASPLLYFSLFTLPVDGGIMITGSHNAAEYNGFKVCVGREAIHGDEIQVFRQVVQAGQFSSGTGRLSEHPIIPDYFAYLKQSFAGLKADRLHVVIDCGNGQRPWWRNKRWNSWAAVSRGSIVTWTGASRTIIPIRPCWRISRISCTQSRSIRLMSASAMMVMRIVSALSMNRVMSSGVID